MNEECEVYEVAVPDEALTDEDEDILNYDDLDDPGRFCIDHFGTNCPEAVSLPPAQGGFFHSRDYNPGEMEDLYGSFSLPLSLLCRPSLIALGAGLGVWGVVNLLEGYGSDNPGS